MRETAVHGIHAAAITDVTVVVTANVIIVTAADVITADKSTIFGMAQAMPSLFYKIFYFFQKMVPKF